MKTSLVVLAFYSKRYERTVLPEEETESMHPPSYAPAHVARGMRSNPKTGKTESSWKEPEAVHTKYAAWHPRAGKLKDLRQLPSSVVDMLEKFDEERATLNKRLLEIREAEQKLLKEAFPNSRILTRDEIRDWTEIRRERRSAEAVAKGNCATCLTTPAKKGKRTCGGEGCMSRLLEMFKATEARKKRQEGQPKG